MPRPRSRRRQIFDHGGRLKGAGYRYELPAGRLTAPFDERSRFTLTTARVPIQVENAAIVGEISSHRLDDLKRQAVAAATGLSDRTIRNGIQELDNPHAPPATRQRRSGAGRKARELEQPGLVEALEKLVESGTRGDLMSPLRWTCKSTRALAGELTRQGFSVSCNTVGRLLRASGYSLQANRKTLEGKQHPDRDAQFRHISRRAAAFQGKLKGTGPITEALKR